MIYNYCIYGELQGYSGPISIEWYSKDLLEYKVKTVQCDNIFQFNLGDRDLCDLNHLPKQGETIRIYIDNVYSKNFVLDNNDIMEVFIDLNDYNETDNLANANNTLVRVLTDKYIIEEDNEEIYSYFKVEKNSILIQEGNGTRLDFIPKESGDYVITQRGYNSSEINPDIIEKVMNISVLENYTETNSIDYVYWIKKKKIVKLELPEYVRSTMLLPNGFYVENNVIYGIHDRLAPLVIPYSRGSVIIKSQVGDILDY